MDCSGVAKQTVKLCSSYVQTNLSLGTPSNPGAGSGRAGRPPKSMEFAKETVDLGLNHVIDRESSEEIS
jgi:hypothetical protein